MAIYYGGATTMTDDDHDDLVELRALSRRFQQANTYVVISTPEPMSTAAGVVMDPAMAIPADAASFRSFFTESLDLDNSTTSSIIGWFGLKSNGRSFGSGNALPSWLQVLGKSLLPVKPLNDDASSSSSVDNMDPALRAAQQHFYQALTSGNLTAMAELYDASTDITNAPLVSQVVAQGGRLDDWTACLQPDARRPAYWHDHSRIRLVGHERWP